MSVQQHFSFNQTSLYDFAHLFLVRCPRCSHCAQVIPEFATTKKPAGPYFVRSIRFVCSSCGNVKQMEKGIVSAGGPFDWYFHYPLYLQISCCGETLWALNFEHLRFLEEYVEADLRENSLSRNSSIASRLPKWMKVAKNRDEVLHCIHKLRAQATR